MLSKFQLENSRRNPPYARSHTEDQQFCGHRPIGGAVGIAIRESITQGFKRGVFSNEAGLGSSVMVHSSFNGLMMVPNLIGVISLCPLVVKITRNYVNRKLKGMDDEPILSYDPHIQAEAQADLERETV